MLETEDCQAHCTDLSHGVHRSRLVAGRQQQLPWHVAGDAGGQPSQPACGANQTGRHQLVDINSASRAQLKTLPGIGDAEADRIIAARPYPSKAKLGAEKVVSDQTYLAIKGLIVAVQPPEPKAKAGTKTSTKP